MADANQSEPPAIILGGTEGLVAEDPGESRAASARGWPARSEISVKRSRVSDARSQQARRRSNRAGIRGFEASRSAHRDGGEGRQRVTGGLLVKPLGISRSNHAQNKSNPCSTAGSSRGSPCRRPGKPPAPARFKYSQVPGRGRRRASSELGHATQGFSVPGSVGISKSSGRYQILLSRHQREQND